MFTKNPEAHYWHRVTNNPPGWALLTQLKHPKSLRSAKQVWVQIIDPSNYINKEYPALQRPQMF